jgi:hypothetical protein
MQRYPTRPERLAAARRAKAREDQAEPRERLNPPFPYVMIPFDPKDFNAKPVWRAMLPES